VQPRRAGPTTTMFTQERGAAGGAGRGPDRSARSVVGRDRADSASSRRGGLCHTAVAMRSRGQVRASRKWWRARDGARRSPGSWTTSASRRSRRDYRARCRGEAAERIRRRRRRTWRRATRSATTDLRRGAFCASAKCFAAIPQSPRRAWSFLSPETERITAGPVARARTLGTARRNRCERPRAEQWRRLNEAMILLAEHELAGRP